MSLIPIGSTFIELDDVRVPVENRIGEENSGFPLIMSSKFRTKALQSFSLLILDDQTSTLNAWLWLVHPCD